MKFQTVYETNADYLESWKKLRVNLGIENLCESSKGHLKFRFKGTDLVVELAEATGKLVIYWHDEKVKKRYYPQLREVLATRDDSPLKIQPLHANIYRVPIPPPDTIRLLWCKRAFRYVREKPDFIAFLIMIVIAFAAFGTCQTVLDFHALNQTGEAMRYVAKMRGLFLWIMIAVLSTAVGSLLLMKRNRVYS